jgi:hypothetical protein
MKLDPGMHIGLHLFFFGKTGVTPAIQDGRAAGRCRRGCTRGVELRDRERATWVSVEGDILNLPTTNFGSKWVVMGQNFFSFLLV